VSIDKILIALLLFFPWRTPVWDFDNSEALFSLLIVFTVGLLSWNRQIRISRWSLFALPMVILIFVGYRYFDAALIARVCLPFILIPFFHNYTIDQRILRFLALASLLYVCLNYVPAATHLVNPFKGRVSTGLLGYQYFRASGLHIYPSDFSFFAILLIMRLRDDNMLKLLLAIAIILSASRAGIAFLLFYFIYNNWFRFVIMGLLFLPGYRLLYEYSPYIKLTVSKILNGEVDGSVQHRASELTYIADILTLKLDPVLKDYSNLGLSVIEGFYSYYLINYGYLGLILTLILILYIGKSIWSGQLSLKSKLFLIFCVFTWFLASDILNHTKNLFFAYMLIFSSHAVYYKHQ